MCARSLARSPGFVAVAQSAADVRSSCDIRLEPLEKRCLLSVVTELDFTASVTHLACADCAVPIVNATVQLTYQTMATRFQQSQENIWKRTTNYWGLAVFKDLNLDPAQNVTVDITAQGVYRQGHNPVSYEVDQFNVAGKTPQADTPFTVEYSKSTVQPQIQLNKLLEPLAIAANRNTQSVSLPIDTNQYSTFANAFAIYSVLYAPTNAMAQPDTVAHEFGHLVAFQNGFADVGGDVRLHYDQANLRGSVAAARPSVLTEAFCEGWADYFAVESDLYSKSLIDATTLKPLNYNIPACPNHDNPDRSAKGR